MMSGRTHPVQFACADGLELRELEVIAKFSSRCDRGIVGLVAEATAAMLAADLELPVPEPFLVALDSEFVQTIKDEEVRSAAANSAPIAFGSRKLPPGFSTWAPKQPVPAAHRQMASEILAFDLLIENPDRRPENPNCLYNGTSFAIYDHEMALPFELPMIGWQPPWIAGALQRIQGGNHLHLFTDALRGKLSDLDRLQGAWNGIGEARLHEYRESLPNEWNPGSEAVDKIFRYLNELSVHVADCLAEVRRVMQ